ncbi:MAG TPA: TraB/GumN family protein [Noviherbaspirillum sp.]
MKSRFVFLLCAVLALLAVPAYAENNAVPSSTTQAAAPQRGTLYRVRHQGSTTYLFGTIHVGKPAFFPLGPEVTGALSRASKLVLEIDIRNNAPFQTALQKHGIYPDDDTIDRHISAETLALLREALQRAGIDYARVRHMKPWLIANMLVGVDLEQRGYQRRHGTEVFLLSLADRETKAVQELETAEYQMSLFDSMSDRMQEQYLRENLAELRDGVAIRKAQALIDAWANANGDALEGLMRESLQERTISSEFMHRVLLDKRNPEMAGKIEDLLRNEETTFVGVGLMHMIGETSVPTLLRQRGYEVEKLY